MNYLPRPLILKRLKLSLRQSYRIIPPSYSSLINSDEILEIVNNARRGIREPLTGIPSDMMTADEIANDPALGGIVPPKRILVWTRRKKNVPPHFRFNKQTTRFSRSSFLEWLSTQSQIRRKRG